MPKKVGCISGRLSALLFANHRSPHTIALPDDARLDGCGALS